MAVPTIAEEWKPVVGYEGRYEASDFGRVRSLVYPEGRGGRILRPHKNNWGYMNVRLTKLRGEVANKRSVHSVVLEAFAGPRPCGLQCNHKDGDKTNNKVENLEWVTVRENSIHAWRVLKRNIPRGSDRRNSKLTTDTVLSIRVLTASGINQSVVARRFCVSQSTISRVHSREIWSHV